MWKTWYGLSVIDITVANADFTGTGIMNREKYQLNLYPLAPAEPPPPLTNTKTATPKQGSSKSSVLTAAPAPAPSITKGDFSGSYKLTRKVGLNLYGFKLSASWGNVKDGQLGSTVDGKFNGWVSANGGGEIEVWSVEFNGVKRQFVELDASKKSHGIKQEVQNAAAGTFLLTWNHMGRNAGAAGNNAYFVKVYLTDGQNEITPLLATASYPQKDKPISKTQFKMQAMVFTVNAKDLSPKDKAPRKLWICFDCPPSSLNTYGTLIDNVRLQSVDVEQPKINADGSAGALEKVDAQGGVRMCRFLSARDGNGELQNKEQFPSQDPDQVVIHLPLVPAVKDAPSVAVKVSTTGGAAPHNDVGSEVIFEKEAGRPGYYVSHPIAIVSSEDEDKFKVGPGLPKDNANADLKGNTDGDLTFIGWPGGKIKLENDELPAPIEIAIKPFTHKITVRNLIVLKGLPGGEVTQANERKARASIAQNMQRMKEIYAQIHVEVVVSDPGGAGDLWRSSLFQPAVAGESDFDKDFEPWESYAPKVKTAVRAKVPGDTVIKFLWLDPAYHGKQFVFDDLLGRSMVHDNAPDIALIFLKLMIDKPAHIKQTGDTAAHEAGHGLGLGFGPSGNGNHVNADGNPYVNYELMFGAGIGVDSDHPDKSSTHWNKKDDGIVNDAKNKKLCPAITP